MKKIVSMILVLTFVLAAFVTVMPVSAATLAPGILNATGNWEVIENGIQANTSESCLVLDKTLEKGTIEFEMNVEALKQDGQPALFFAGTGFENVNVLGNAAIEGCTTDSVMCWIQPSGMNVSAMAKGQWTGGVHHGKGGAAFTEVIGKKLEGKNTVVDWDKYTKDTITFKVEFADGKVTSYANGVKGVDNVAYSATGKQIAFRGSAKNGVPTQITNIKVNGEAILFGNKAPEVDPPVITPPSVDSGDATFAVAGLVVIAGICAGAAITYAKKRTVA